MRLRDFKILNFAPKTGSNESLLLAYSKTVFRIEIGTVIRELSRLEVFKMTILRNFFLKKFVFLEKKGLREPSHYAQKKAYKNTLEK